LPGFPLKPTARIHIIRSSGIMLRHQCWLKRSNAA
jgi:hypothetical protein